MLKVKFWLSQIKMKYQIKPLEKYQMKNITKNILTGSKKSYIIKKFLFEYKSVLTEWKHILISYKYILVNTKLFWLNENIFWSQVNICH